MFGQGRGEKNGSNYSVVMDENGRVLGGGRGIKAGGNKAVAGGYNSTGWKSPNDEGFEDTSDGKKSGGFSSSGWKSSPQEAGKNLP